VSNRDIDSSSENVLSDWDRAAGEVDEPVEGSADEAEAEVEVEVEVEVEDEGGAPAWGTAAGTMGADDAVAADELAAEALSALEEGEEGEVSEPEPVEEELEAPADASPDEGEGTPFPVELSHEHAAGDLLIPDGYAVIEGVPEGGRRAVGLVVSRFNGSVTTRLLDRALEELAAAGVRQEAITVMVVPGAFELPLAATALAKTRRFACIVALGCVIRGDTPHFDYVASEAASGLQLAALETGVPVSFGVLTLERVEQAEPRIEKGAEAVRSALEMADLFAHLRAAASR
jgi:6,7-dimethyl-8-ribityllumazine synthase